MQKKIFTIDESVRSLIPHFVIHQYAELQLMEKNLENGNMEEVSRLGHSLKGAAANFNLEPLRKLGVAIQDVAKMGMNDALAPLLARYRLYLEELKSMQN
ncbi:HPt (histidine-containing phosphotransfer) domain-containing protein [Maridesulfovibrio ferrireducens]|uniref:HPt (Histidine-containing phosphotransfer) domain-containing protein n=1 Tax=Maridesulfovibrio ferrireducens TaxID=246191 RepID=A0A1G9KCP3_9BACT|nr:Hpt domain-containing protein [Maridesulfovibrio ferrireducens]SDL47359.1 HPt (histidine-containing phosphotransfer) domain-containing protein [Maridesulfovibrio ferrireducens]